MGDGTKIEWSDATWNPFVGCTAVSPGCDHCYAARQSSGRLKNTPTYAGLADAGIFNGTIRLLPERLDQPLKWTRPRRIFVNSMSDVFHEGVPDDYIARVFAVMALTRRHSFQVLTKRHGRMRALLRSPDFAVKVAEEATTIIGHTPGHLGRRLDLGGLRLAGDSGDGNGWTVELVGGENLWTPPWPLPNVWIGVSVEDQKWADIRIPALLDTPAAVRFLSCEPLLGPIERLYLTESGQAGICYDIDGGWWHTPGSCPSCRPRPDWVIVGGESGPGGRPVDPGWVRGIRDACVEAGVAFHFKQWGGIRAKAGGRELDGRTWDEWPQVREAVRA